MAPQRLLTKHCIVQPSLGKLPYNEVYYEWSSREEDNVKEVKAEEVAENHVQEGGQAMPVEKTAKEGDVLQPFYDHLHSSKIEALRIFEIVCVQNTYLTREVILLEEQNITLQSINHKLEYLVRLNDKLTTSSPPPYPKNKL